jgi:heme exporter protein A
MVATRTSTSTSSSSDAPPSIELDAVARRFGRQWPLRAISMRVERGEGVALLGRNGSGKTTLLRVIATTLRPTRGTGRIFGHDLVTDADLVRERIGVLSHVSGLYPDLTAVENLEFAQRMRGESVDRRAIDVVLDRVGMTPHASERVRIFSAGMTRRVALARMLLHRHELLLLDEPYASFDADGIVMLNEVLLEARERGATVVIATHDPERARVVCGRMLEIEAGQLVDVDSGRVQEAAR